jgi:type 1 glutamine amidotransferase
MNAAIPILLVSSGSVHPSWPNRVVLRRLLARSGCYAIREVPSLEVVSKADWAGARALVFYAHMQRISEAALAGLESYLAGGGGLLGVHSAAASFKQEPRYHALLGGRFTGHGPVKRFQVFPVETPAGIFQTGLPFWLRDERYLHETRDDVQVHFYSQVEGQREPLVWTRQAGAGRVCYCAAGHTFSSLAQAPLRQILLDGLAWVCEGTR